MFLSIAFVKGQWKRQSSSLVSRSLNENDTQTDKQVSKTLREIITRSAVIKEVDSLGNGWVAASDWVVREGGDIKLRVESKNEAAISSRTFQGVNIPGEGTTCA